MNLRLFIAIAVPPEMRIAMTRAQQELRPLAAPEDVRWVRPEQLHLTLKFLGNVPADSVGTMKNSLVEACVGISPFQLRANGIGFFPNARSPRVIWIGLKNEGDGLIQLQSRVETFFTPFAERQTGEKFLAHVTIGRFQKFRRHKAEKLLARALSFKNHAFGEWRVEEINLMQSELSPSGAIHKKLFSARL
jgi:2'-5' RNA ligase